MSTDQKLDKQNKISINRLKVRPKFNSTDQKLDQEIKSWINRLKVKSKLNKTDQKLEQRKKMIEWRLFEVKQHISTS